MRRANQSTRKSEQSPAFDFKSLMNGQSSKRTDHRHHCWPVRSDVKGWPIGLRSPHISFLPTSGNQDMEDLITRTSRNQLFRSFSSGFVVSALNIEAYWLYSCNFLHRRNHMESATTITAASSIVQGRPKAYSMHRRPLFCHNHFLARPRNHEPQKDAATDLVSYEMLFSSCGLIA